MTMPISIAQVKSASLDVVLAILWLGMMSVTVIESDFYRYAALLLMGLTLAYRRPPLRANSSDWLAILCVAWGAFALVRFLFGLIVDGEKGASEWLYAFAIFFPARSAIFWMLELLRTTRPSELR